MAGVKNIAMQYEGKIYGRIGGKYVELKADSRMVDAAPDLLEALKSAVNRYDIERTNSIESYTAFYGIAPPLEDQEWEHPEWVVQARAAIAKAESTTL